LGSCCYWEGQPSAADGEFWRAAMTGMDAVVVNVAAHWAGQEGCQLTTANAALVPQVIRAFRTTIAQLLRTLAVEARGKAVWWRTQPPGHPDCDVHVLPMTSSTLRACSPDPALWGPRTRARSAYCWQRIPALNRIASQLFIAAGHRVLFADVPTLLRPDAHVGPGVGLGSADCLHYCLSGPPRMYALAIARFVLSDA
jgi:hypothetical protein